MATAGKSLRLMVDHWLAPDAGQSVRVIAFRNQRSRHERYVCIQTHKPTGPVALFFFRHQDGTWCVYPPRGEQPMMRAA